MKKRKIAIVAFIAIGAVYGLTYYFNNPTAYIAEEVEEVDTRDIYQKVGDELAEAMRDEARLLEIKTQADAEYSDALARTNCAMQAINTLNKVETDTILNCSK